MVKQHDLPGGKPAQLPDELAAYGAGGSCHHHHAVPDSFGNDFFVDLDFLALHQVFNLHPVHRKSGIVVKRLEKIMGNEQVDAPLQADVGQLFFLQKISFSHENDGRGLENIQNLLHIGNFLDETHRNALDFLPVRMRFRRQDAHNLILITLQAFDQGSLQQAGIQFSDQCRPLASGCGNGSNRFIGIEILQPSSSADARHAASDQR